MNDQKILESILSGSSEKAIKVLYKEFPKIKSHIIANSGNAEKAEEVFHDGLIILIEKVRQPNFELSSKLSTFLFGICKFLWKNELRKKDSTTIYVEVESIVIDDYDLDYHGESEARYHALERVITSLSEKCQKIFQLFYFEHKKMDKIASLLGFSSVNSAKTQKYKCMEVAIKKANEIKIQSQLS